MNRSDFVGRIIHQVDDLRTLRIQSVCQTPWQRDISLPQLHILVTLHENGPTTVSAIAKQCAISMPSASTIVDRMEDHDLVSRVREDSDRRVVTVDLTDRGRDAVEEFIGLKRHHLDELLGVMSDEDLVDLSRGLDALQRGIKRGAGMHGSSASKPHAIRKT